MIGFLGVVIGALISLYGVRYAHKLTLEKAEIDRKNEIRALIQSIKDEVETLRGIYMDSVGDGLEKHKEGEPFKYYFLVTQEYFTVYSSNADKIGMIKDDGLRKSIVEAYSAGRSLIDTYNTNNDIFRTYDHNNRLFNITEKPVFKEEADYNIQRMSEYATALKTKHLQFKEAVDALLNNIENFN